MNDHKLVNFKVHLFQGSVKVKISEGNNQNRFEKTLTKKSQ